MSSSYEDLKAIVGDRDSKKVANNTYIQRRSVYGDPYETRDAFAVHLHATDVVTYYPDGKVILNTGGWQTVTTKARMNDYLPLGLWISSTKGEWHVYDVNGRVEFESGMDVGNGI